MSFWDPTQLCGKTAINNLDLCMNYEQEEDSCKFFCWRRKPQRGYKYPSPPNEDFSVLMMLVRFGFSCFILRSIWSWSLDKCKFLWGATAKMKRISRILLGHGICFLSWKSTRDEPVTSTRLHIHRYSPPLLASSLLANTTSIMTSSL
jgi:hypothetical protein